MALTSLALATAALAVPAHAQDDLPFSQQVKLVKDGMSGKIRYRVVREKPIYGMKSYGRVAYDFDVYQLVEATDEWDYYLLDANVRRIRGGGYPFANIQVMLGTFPGFTHNRATYTAGRATFEKDCKTYPVNLGASYGPVSAGTTVTKIRSCDDEPEVSRFLSNRMKRKKRGYRNGTYSVRAMARMPRVGMQKWIRVKEGSTPPFYAAIRPRRTTCVEKNASGKCADWKDFWADGRTQLMQFEDSTRN